MWTPDETRYAQISQEMLQSGNWVAPHFMGIRYFEKPAGGYWLIALGQAVFGQNLFGVRIASALTSGLSVLLAYLIARRLWNDPRKSFACALLYLSFGLIAGQAGYSNLDPQFTLWVNLSLVALWFALDSSTPRSRLGAWAVLGFACAMGFMTKGFLAWALPVLIALPYMLWQRRLGELLRYGPLAICVAVLVCLPWVLAIHSQEPDFWRFFFWNEHIRRFSADNAQHVRPWWFFLPIIAVSCLPWAGLLPSTLRATWQQKRQPAIAFLALWLLLPLVFFSLSNGKLPTYIMPCLLPLALLMGHTLSDLLRLRQARTISPQWPAQLRDRHGGHGRPDLSANRQARVQQQPRRDVQPVPGVYRVAGVDTHQPAASLSPVDAVGHAGAGYRPVGDSVAGEHAASDRR